MTDKKTQKQKFIDTAREIGADEDERSFERKLRRVAKPPTPQKKSKKEKPAD